MRKILKQILNRLFSFRVPDSSLKAQTTYYFRVPKWNYSKELWLDQLLKKIDLHSDEVFLDVGVNVGQTLIKWSRIYPESHYIGFEPNPNSYLVSNSLVSKNKLSNVTIIPIGLSNETGLVPINISSSDLLDSGATIIQGFRKGSTPGEKSFIPVFTLDSQIDKLTDLTVKILKIDVEGAENEVLEGAKHLLQTHRPVILIEVLPSYSIENEFRVSRQRQLMDLLKGHNYTIFQVKKAPKQIALEEIDQFPIHSDVSQSDYVCVPTESPLNLENRIKD